MSANQDQPLPSETAIVYNVTTKTETSIAAAWVEWMQTEHIPAILATGCFVRARILQLTEIDDSEGPTYAVQYEANSKAHYTQYIELHAAAMRTAAELRWGASIISFRSVLRVVN